MKVSILHISDLHRSIENPIRNDVLLDSLENDCRRFSAEEDPEVQRPDLIVVSGDVVQGVRPDAVDDPESALRQQYDEASDFLARLTERFVDGDRSRVVIVPGNHDVSAHDVQESLELVEVLPDRKKDLVAQLFRAGSSLRWSWSELSLHRITDHGRYARRMAAFARFYGDFYEGTRIFEVDPARQLDFFDYPEFELTIVGFSSCHNNDLLNRQGAIHPGCIAEAGKRFRHPSFAGRLRMAVWHHNTEGTPMRTDYMDPDLIQNLIDRGFSLGLHGHQHRPQYLDTRFRHGGDRKMTVISAGTLCGGPDFRHGRAYNVIELNPSGRTGRLHVREMQNDNLSLPIWGRRALPPNTRPYYSFGFDQPPPAAAGSAARTRVLVEAQELHLEGEYKEAAELLVTVVEEDDLARQPLLDCLAQLGDGEGLLRHFWPPTSEAEAIHVMAALWDSGDEERLREAIESPLVANTTDSSLVEIRDKYRARLR